VLAQDTLVAVTLYELGNINYFRSDYNQAIDYHEQSLKIWQDLVGEQHLGTARSYNNLGLIYQRTGDYEQALALHQKTMDIRIALLGPDHAVTSGGYQNLSNVYRVFGYYDKGIEYAEKGLAIRVRDYGEDHPETSNFYNSISALYQAKGDFNAALSYVKKALQIYESTYGDKHLYIPMLNLNMCSLYINLKQFDEALSHCTQANKLFEGIVGQNHQFTARSNYVLGLLYYERGEYADALASYARKQEILDRVVGKDHIDQGHLSLGRANVYARLRQDAKAVQEYEKALQILRRSVGEHSSTIAEVLYHRARLHDQRSEYDTSRAMYSESLCVYLIHCEGNLLQDIQLLDAMQLSDWPVKIVAAYMDATLRQHQEAGISQPELEELLMVAVEAIDLLAEVRNNYTAESSKVALGETSASIFEGGIQAAMLLYHATRDDSYKERAFYIAQKSKTSVFLDALTESKAQQFAGIPDSLLTYSKELRIDLAFYKTKLYEEQLKGAAADSASLNTLRKRTFNLEKTYVDLLADMEQEYPDYYRLKYDVSVTNPVELQTQVLDSQTVLVEYFLGTDSLYTFVLSDSATEVYSAPVDSSFFGHIVSMREGITTRDYQTYIASAQYLNEALIKPWAYTATMNKLIVVPDGELNLVPFEALLTAPPSGKLVDYQNLPYLLNEYAIQYAHSATLLSQNTAQLFDEPAKDFIAFAPIFEGGVSAQMRGGEVLGIEGLTEKTQEDAAVRKMGHLPETERETKEILGLFRSQYSIWDRMFGGRSRVFWAQDATESQVKEEGLSEYRYVHFATHGVVNETIPDLSGIVLVEDTTSQEDGVLHLSEVYNLDLNAELVVLSACETGLGKIAKGEGLIGLTRGFMYSGAQSVAVSLWKVEDTSTSDLMIGYYDGILNGKKKAEALRESKQSLIASSDELAQPYYWAGFIQVGD
nr:CHAT domain-containing protein [Rhodothermaceae bacterium]